MLQVRAYDASQCVHCALAEAFAAHEAQAEAHAAALQAFVRAEMRMRARLNTASAEPAMFPYLRSVPRISCCV